jgi:hemolysin activation/secretion protein
MPRNLLFLLALMTLGSTVLAAPPVGEAQMQQIPSVPPVRNAAPLLELDRVKPAAATTADSVRITVNRLSITGAKAFTETELLKVTGFAPGGSLSISDLRAMALKIAEFYRDRGYFVATAYLPEQDIRNGSVNIAVVEGSYGRVTLNNRSAVSDAVAQALLGGLAAGDSITAGPLERRLLTLSDLPGVKVSSTLMPGATAGSSDLLVELDRRPRITGSVDADNAGNRYTGMNRAGATITLNEPLGLGDVASVRGLTSGPGLDYLRGTYQLQAGPARLGLAYSTMRYSLSQEFQELGATGSADIGTLNASLPLLRSRNNNVNFGLALESRKYQDRISAIASVTDKSLRVVIASLSADTIDRLGGGGTSVYSLAWSSGVLDLQTPSMRETDAVTARTNGYFNKLALSAARLQTITSSLSFFASINGQAASKYLDVSEEFPLGGMNGVRAYPEGEAYADEGYVVNLEFRFALPGFDHSLPGQLQLIAFADAGTVVTSKSPWGNGTNSRTLSGAGLGVNWSEINNFYVRVYYAVKLGNEPASSGPDATERLWGQGVKYF